MDDFEEHVDQVTDPDLKAVLTIPPKQLEKYRAIAEEITERRTYTRRSGGKNFTLR